ncbi:MAG TPA: hypothetical protein V6C69_18290 [Trichormus sp.]|jgi:hypothetical protein
MPETISLNDIQKLQFSDKPRAERAIQQMLERHEGRPIDKVELNPKPESLNSVNGFVTFKNGDKYFFKTHTEENEQISEYYNASVLAENGYPVIAAKQISHSPGQQLVLYEILTLPTLFDLVKEAEDSQPAAPFFSEIQALLSAQIDLDKTTFAAYKKTLRESSATEHAQAPINQLFHHRLQQDGRLGLYYAGKNLALDNEEITFERLSQLSWNINGAIYDRTLSNIIAESQNLMEPHPGPAVIGHGDAHNGNIFVDRTTGKFHMFDPAFAGVHSPILDLVKPTFHNVFARWMYYPLEVANEFELSYKIDGNKIAIEHNYHPSQLRLGFLESRRQNVIEPTIKLLKQQDMLPDSWREYMRAALFCCPFLTVNLFATPVTNGTLSERYPLKIKLLGVAMAVELGAAPQSGTNKLSATIADLLKEE